jgi:ribose 5-phosphate isomerase A
MTVETVQYTYNFPDDILPPERISYQLGLDLHPKDKQKLLMMSVGWEIAQEIETGDRITVGSGRTAEAATWAIGQRIAKGEILDISGIATSRKLALLSDRRQIAVADFDTMLQAIQEKRPLGRFRKGYDGADEIEVILDENGTVTGFRCIKGGGGAHLVEKIVDSCCDELVFIVDESKLVPKLGDFAVALEVEADREEEVEAELRCQYPNLISLDYKPAENNVDRFLSDLGRHILRVKFGEGNIPNTMEDDLNKIPGVVDNGLFLKVQPKLVLIAGNDGKIHRLQVGQKIDKTHPLANRIFKQNCS